MEMHGINTYNSGGWRWVTVEAAEGVKITGVTLGEGINPEAPIEIAEDGRSVKIGFADDAQEEIIPTLAEGKLTIDFEGAPTDPNARIAYARIWINSNESRAYNAYEDKTLYTVTFVDYDGTVIAEEKVAPGKAATAPANPVRPGYRFLGWDTSFSVVTKNITTIATYRQIPQTQVVEGFELVGATHWKVHTGQRMSLPGCEVEILHTHEDYFPKSYAWGNHTSSAFRFKFKRCVGDAVFLQFFAHTLFDGMRIPLCYNMHRGIIRLTVHTPNMNMVHTENAFNLANMLRKFMNVDPVGRFFKKEFQHFF
jgi:hypothetical protein